MTSTPTGSATSARVSGVRAVLQHPLTYMLAPLLTSFIVWAVPGSSDDLRGFQTRATGGLAAWTFLIMFYVLAGSFLTLGYRIGRSRTPTARSIEISASKRFGTIFATTLTLLSLVGTAAVVLVIAKDPSALTQLESGLGNNVRSSVVGEGTSGILSLKYAPGISAPVAIWRWYRKEGSIWSVLLNAALAIVSAIISGRIVLLMVVVATIFMLAHVPPVRRIRARWLVLLGAAALAVLTFTNFSRNSLWYQARGITNPFAMNFYQIAAYLGAPAQASLGVANAITAEGYNVHTSFILGLERVMPTTVIPDSALPGSASYRNYVDVASNLTTNSTFADIFGSVGWWGLFFALVVLFLGGVVCGMFTRYPSIVVSGGALIAYAVSETWRIELFRQGIFWFLLLSVLLAWVIASTVTQRRSEPLTGATALPAGRLANNRVAR